MAVGTGSKSFTVQTSKSFGAGEFIVITQSNAVDGAVMSGTVTSYDSSTGALVVNVVNDKGSGTIASWDVRSPVAVVRVSAMAIGSQGTDFTAPTTSDLVNWMFRDIGVDGNGLADIGVYLYRCGYNSTGFSGVTAENTLRYGMLGLGLYALKTGELGVFSNYGRGFQVGHDVWGWEDEQTVYASSFKVIANGNGRNQTFVENDSVTDWDGAALVFRGNKGSSLEYSAELNYGRSVVIGGGVPRRALLGCVP